jgi:hypothetical protein
MRAYEFIKEEKTGHVTQRQQQASVGMNTYFDKTKANTDYVGFKLGQGMAMADGSDNELDIDAISWAGKRKTVHPYTELEQKMFKQAAKAVGAEYDDVNHGDMHSKELDDTYKQSPVAGFKGFEK